MDFTFTAEQEQLHQAVRDLAADRSTSAQVRAAMAGPTGHDPGLWQLVAEELGLVGLVVPETAGGSGGSFVDAAVVLEESGRSLLPVPLLPGLVAAAALAGAEAAAVDLAAVAAGSAIATLAVGDLAVAAGMATGELHHVVDGAIADLVVVATPEALLLVRADDDAGVQVESRPTLDPTRRQATVRLEGAAVRAIGDPTAAARAGDLLRVALAVELVGVMRWCLAATVEHLKTRVQFDRPIGSFQALQHRAADLVVQLEAAASTAYYASWAAADAPDELPVVAPMALAVCGDAVGAIAGETIQMHGGIGFTWEHDAHLYFKRATASRLLIGDTHEQRRLVAARAPIG